jgi:DNA helicase-2/ATP-dependent DNA helicase PcrA
MTGRVHDLVTRDTSDLWAGTFHAIGSRILRRHPETLGFTRSYSIMDRDDQKSMLRKVVAACEINTESRRFPKPEVLAAVFGLAANTCLSLETILYTHHADLYEWLDDIERVHTAYQQRKAEANSMDFDDLLTQTLKLFETRPDLLALYQQRFRHILVDEYQDTNAVQGRLIDLLAGAGASLMAVGDDAQSIYSWRGADMGLILGFRRRYPDAEVFTIETNYRSVPEILDLSNEAIRGNKARIEKNLRAVREPSGIKPAVVPLFEPRTQAAFVAQRIQELRESGVSLAEIAVIYRAHFQSLELQLELTVRGVPFAITSGLRFFEQAHIKDVAAFLRFVVNRRDEESFLRMVQLLPGCGPGAAEKLWREWLATGWPAKETLPVKWSDILLLFTKVPKKSAKHWAQLCHTLDELSPNGFFAKPGEMIFSVMEGVYKDYLTASYDNAESRQADLEQLANFAAGFDDIGSFLEQVSLLGNADGETGSGAGDEERVTLSSIHQAKGLEWEVVFVIGLVDGQFPNARAMEGGDANLEEERRLFYVATTRAKDQLYLTYPLTNPRAYAGDYSCSASRFLAEIPPAFIEEWSVDDEDEDEPF